MSGMGRKLVTSYAALGVGLAMVLTLGLTAISSVIEQPSNQFMTSQQEPAKSTLQAPVPAVPAQPSPMPQKATREAAPASAPSSTYSGGGAIQKAPATQEPSKPEEAKSYSLTAEVPPSPFAGLMMVLPYIAAAAVGSVVFVLTRKRVG